MEDAVIGLYNELAYTREMLDRRLDDLEGGKVQPIDGEEAYRRLMEKTEANASAAGMSGYALHAEALGTLTTSANTAEDNPDGRPDASRNLRWHPRTDAVSQSGLPLQPHNAPAAIQTVWEYVIAHTPENCGLWPCAMGGSTLA